MKVESVIAIVLAAAAVWYARKNAMVASASNSQQPLAPAPISQANIASTGGSTNGVPDAANYQNPLAFQKSHGSGAVSTGVTVGASFPSSIQGAHYVNRVPGSPKRAPLTPTNYKLATKFIRKPTQPVQVFQTPHTAPIKAKPAA